MPTVQRPLVQSVDYEPIRKLGAYMPEIKNTRTWQEIAKEIERERDNEKLINLTFELLRALPEGHSEPLKSKLAGTK
jgi:hypothetical protein